MTKNQRKYIYISNLDFDGTVFKTQVLDWLNLYQVYNLEFDLIQVFHVKDLKSPGYLKSQIRGIRKCAKHYIGSLFFFPSKSIFYIINTFVLFIKIFRYVFKYQEVLIFSRAIIGKEIAFLRKIFFLKIFFYFDARAASAEENKYMSVKNSDFSLSKYIIIANIYYLEYKTLCAADKIFVVSNVLKKYFQDTYNLSNKRFVFYPCLADSEKFYYNSNIRSELRAALNINKQTRVFIYSGGIESEWHISEKMFTFFNQVFKHEKASLFICLTKHTSGLQKILRHYPELESNLLSFSVINEEVYKYLNAADYGILFRENTIMNNVASPTKLAEYMLCGLPVLISEGVGDYSDFIKKNDVGILIKESELNEPEMFDFNKISGTNFNRSYIADVGRKNFSKDSAINNILLELQS